MDKQELENRLIKFSVMIIEIATKNPNSKIVNHKSLIYFIIKAKGKNQKIPLFRLLPLFPLFRLFPLFDLCNERQTPMPASAGTRAWDLISVRKQSTKT